MNIALILSGGTGTRLGASTPKQYIEVNGKSVIAYAVEAFVNCHKIDRIHIVADRAYWDYLKKVINNKLTGFSLPGENRQLSILNGLRDIKKYADNNDNIIIHDAARPFVKVDTIEAIIKKLNKYEAVTPVLPIKDTVYYYDFANAGGNGGGYDGSSGYKDSSSSDYEGGSFVSTADRSRLVAGQTPEGFKLGKYLFATEALLPDKIRSVTGSLQVALDGGLKATAVDGDEDNFKITTQNDLNKFIEIVS